MKKINNIKKNLNIIQVESELSNYNSKSVSTEEYISYCSKKLEINKILESSYENIKFRQYKWYNYICRERSYGKMLNEFENVLGKDATLIIGDASLGVNMWNIISTPPNVTIKRKLNTRFRVLSIDEFRTSCINCYTHKRENTKLKYKGKDNKTRSLHSVLTYKMENNRLGCINRDNNAVKNMKYIYDYYIEYLRGNVDNPRPEIFCRKNKDL